MVKIKHFKIVLAAPVFVLALAGMVAGQVIYVDAGAAGANNGSSWPDAFNSLQDALAAAVSGDVIWVSAGVYKPDQGFGIIPGDRAAAFQLKSGVAVYGGFAGMETALEQRDWRVNLTILSGDIGTPDSYPDNSIHVVVGSYTDRTAVLDGFTVTEGHADGVGYPNFMGGGMLIHDGDPTVANCIFSDCLADTGGGMYTRDSNALLTECIFRDNSVLGDAGGIGCSNDASYSNRVAIVNCRFIGNIAGRMGGAMENFICATQMINCVFSGNTAARWGGVMFNQGTMGPKLMNCSFIGNSAGERGGVMYDYPNCIPKVTNCILWDNRAPVGAQIDYSLQGPHVSYSDVEGGWPGEENIDSIPSFIQAGYWSAEGSWVEGDYHLTPASPCVETGTNDVSISRDYDADGNPRIVDGDYDGEPVIDMGAYEYQGIIEVQIDIKPGSDPNSINLNSGGNVPVAVFSTEDFDATGIDPESVTLASASVRLKGKGTPMASFEDVNGDGILDIVVHISTSALELSDGDTQAVLEGETFDGKRIRGADSVRIIR